MTDAPPEAPTDASHDPAETAPHADDASASDDVTASDGGTAGDDGALTDSAGVRDAARVAAWTGLAVSLLVGFVALWRFYHHAAETIVALVPRDLVDPFLAGFNLALLLVAGAAALVLVRWLHDGEEPV